MVIKYENGKIYKIIGNVPTDPCYVGSTTKDYLSQRMTQHISDYRYLKRDTVRYTTTSFKMFEKYGIENCKIILLELVNAKTKDELRQREQFYIDTLNCVNKMKARSLTEEEKKEYKKQYQINNKDKIQLKGKKYYVENKDIICAKVNEYRQANIDIVRERKKQYTLNQGKATIQAQRTRTYHCTSCNYELRLCKKSRHVQTSRHIINTINYMKSFVDKYNEQIKNESNIIQHFSLE